MNLTWKEVFNTDLKTWDWEGLALDAATDAGYTYYTWNGWVYPCEGVTGEKVCKVEELT